MARTNRRDVLAAGEIQVVHYINRCVRRWEQHVRRPQNQQVERLNWDTLLFTSFVYFPCLLPVIVSFEEFKTPAFTSAFTSPALAVCLLLV